MSTGKSISNLLEDALDLIGKGDEPDSTDGAPQISAAKQLLSERSKGKRGIESDDFVAFQANKKPTVANPFMNQISSSSVDDPKYWKTASTKSKGSIPAKTMKFAMGSTNQNKSSKSRISKGEKYSDRYSAKQDNRTKKNNLRKILKS
jgi:type II secretory pathway pseudopilin PulG